MKFKDVTKILEAHGFEPARRSGSHETWRGIVDGETKVLVLAYSRPNEDVGRNTLSNISRRSGLPKKLFRR